MAAAASKSVLRLETKTDVDLQVARQDKLDQKVGQEATVPKQGVIQTKAKPRPKKRPPPVGTIAEALKRKRLGAGAGAVSSKSSTDRVIDASFWVRRLKPSARSSACSAYDTVRDKDKDEANQTHPAQETPPHADRDGLSFDVQTSNRGARQQKSKRAVYTFAFVLAWGLVASLLQFTRHHSARRISAFRQLMRFPTGTRGARWTSKWFPNIRQIGAFQHTKLLYAKLTSDGFMYYGRWTSHPICSHLLSRAWSWIWCHDDSQTWGIVKSVRGAYKAVARLLRRDVTPGLALLTYMIFILVCMEIIADLLLGIRGRLQDDPPRLPSRKPINFFRQGILIRMGVRYSYGSLVRKSQRATQGLVHHVPGHHVILTAGPMQSCQDIPIMDRSGVPSGRHLVFGLLLERSHGGRLFSSQPAGSLRVVYYGMRSALYNMGLSGPKSGCSGTTSLVQLKSTAAEVRVWPCASGQEPGVSIRSMHDNMSGKPRITLSHWFQEYCSFGRAILRMGQRLTIRRWQSAFTKQAVQPSVRRAHQEKQSQPKRHASSPKARTWTAQVWTFMLAIICAIGRAMRMWLALCMLLFHVVNPANAGASPANAGASPAITGREMNTHVLVQPPHPPHLPQLAEKARSAKPTFQKRALGRAINHAFRDPSGHTTYRGRRCTHTELQQSRPHPQQLRKIVRQHRQPKPQTAQPGELVPVICATWNSNGLEGGVLEEYMLWLAKLPHQNQPQLLAIQETHWRTNAEWVTGDGWLCVASGAGERDRSAGIMTMVKMPGVKQQHVRIRRVVPGRLDHIRIDTGATSIDVINVYQKAVSFTQSNEAYEKRSMIWKSISKILSGIPARNSVIILGDLNTQLATTRPWVGPCTMLSETAEQISRDHSELLDLLRKFDLTVLNSWACRRPHTYVHGSHHTLIDYIIARRSQASGKAKQSKPVHDDSLTGWRESKHYPVFAHFSHRLKHARHSQPRWRRLYDIAKITQQDTTQDYFRQQAARVQEAVDHMSMQTYSALPVVLRQICDQNFSLRTDKPKPRWCDEGMKNRVSFMWHSYRCSKGLDATTIRSQEALSSLPASGLIGHIFRRWADRCSFLRLHKETRRFGRYLKQQRFLGILTEAQTAIQHKNQHGLFRVVRSLAPKQRPSNMQIYGPGGELVSKNKEVEILERHFSGVWKQPPHWQPPVLRTAIEDHDGLTFTPPSVSEVCRAIATIRAHKAVPNQLPPAAIWKQHGAIIGRAAHRLTNPFWTEGGALYPDSWHDTYLVLLQKPNKPQGVPSSLRPVGLQDPLAKSYTSLLTKKLTPYALSYLSNVPQFAYISGRDILGSLERAVRHCKQVRSRMKAGSYNLWSRRFGHARKDFTVGLQVSLDLSQAFDTVPWCLLDEALIRAGVPNNLRDAVMAWVSSTKYLIEHRQQTIRINAERGVRQGCGLSPLLWSIFSGLVYKEFAEAHGKDSSFPTITLFADDHHLSWILDEPGEISTALAQLSNFVSFLRRFGLKVNPSKSQAMLLIQGVGSDKLRQAWTYQTKIDGKIVTKLRLPGAPRTEHVTLVKHMDYLGITLTYGRIEETTMQRRIGVAQGNFDRLRRVLNNRRVLNSSQRLGLWQATVLPSLNYGILAVGVSKLSLERYHGIIMRHIRSITNKPLQITKIGNRELLQLLGLVTPVSSLINQASARMDNISARWMTRHDPMMHNAELWAQLCDTYDSLQAHAFRYNNDGSGPVPAEPELLHKCTECDRGFSTQSSLRLHVSKVHTGKKKDRSIKVQDPEAEARKHGTNGMPQCRYCGLQMQRWPNLNRRITFNRCEKYLAYLREEAPLPPEPQPLVENSEVLGAFRKSGRQYLLKNIPRWEEARTHCSICRQWIARQADFKSHLKKTHQALWFKYGSRAEKLVTPTTLNGKCEICLQTASGNTKHKCPVLLQVQFAALIDGGRSTRHDGTASIGEGAAAIRRVVGEAKAEEGSLARGGSQPREAGEQGIQDRSGREAPRPGQERQRIQWKEQGRPSAGGPQPADQHDGKTCNPTRGLVEPSEGGPRVLPFSSHSGFGRDNHKAAISDLTDMEGTQGPESTSQTITAPGGPLHNDSTGVDGTGQTGSGGRRGSQEGCRGTDDPNAGRRQRKRNAFMGLFGLQSLGKARGHGSEHSAAGSGPPDETPQGHTGAHSWRDDSALPRATSPGYGDGGRSIPHGAGDLSVKQRGATGIGRSTRPHEQQHMEAHRSSLSEGQDSEIAIGHAHSGNDQGTDIQLFMRIVLLNPSNRCYQNSLLMVLQWLRSMCGIILPSQLDDIMTQLTSHARIDVVNIPDWMRLLGTWAQPEAQHDVAEFMSHILQATPIDGMVGMWNAFQGDRQTDESDLSTTALPLVVFRMRHVQQCIDSWHMDGDTRRYLLITPKLLVIQLLRFRLVSGRIRKLTSKVDIPVRLTLPALMDVRPSTISYRVYAGIFHLGGTPSSGHYRSFVRHLDPSGYLSCIVTDDNRRPEVTTPQIDELIKSNVYLLFCVREDA